MQNYNVRSKTKKRFKEIIQSYQKNFKNITFGQSIYLSVYGALYYRQNSIQIDKETLNQPFGNKRERIFKAIFWSSKRGKNILK